MPEIPCADQEGYPLDPLHQINAFLMKPGEGQGKNRNFSMKKETEKIKKNIFFENFDLQKKKSVV